MDPDIRTIVKKSLGKKYIRVENDTLQILLDQADKEMVNCFFDIVLRVFNVNIPCIQEDKLNFKNILKNEKFLQNSDIYDQQDEIVNLDEGEDSDGIEAEIKPTSKLILA